jgi:hypothetical protein
VNRHWLEAPVHENRRGRGKKHKCHSFISSLLDSRISIVQITSNFESKANDCPFSSISHPLHILISTNHAFPCPLSFVVGSNDWYRGCFVKNCWYISMQYYKISMLYKSKVCERVYLIVLLESYFTRNFLSQMMCAMFGLYTSILVLVQVSWDRD